MGHSETFTYDPVGNLTARTDRKGQTITYTYDALNRLTAKTLPRGTSVTYAYDPLGRLLAAADANGPLAFTYDPLGRVLSATTPEGRTLTYTYDAAGNRIGLQDETGRLTTYAYDPRDLLTSLTDPRTGAFTFAYDRLGRQAQLTRPNGTSTTYAYDPASRLTALTHTGPKGPFEALGYTYDPASNRVADTRNRTAHQYAYDPLDQLLQVQHQEHRSRWKVKEGYTYDPVGNRLTGPHKETYAYDAANRLTQDTTSAYAYDANGNLIEKRNLKDGRVTTYTYDAEDRLSRVVTPTAEVTFQYDPLGRRTEKRVIRWDDEDGDREPDPDEEDSRRVTRYLYDQEDILAMFTDSGKEVARYAHGPGTDEPLAELRRHRVHFYHADVLGSIIALSEKHGHPVRAYRYSAFGLPEDHKGDPQPYRYTGREWDKETGLYFYRARYYAPRSGRFLTEDPIGLLGGVNFYRYVLNNPVVFIDPLGLDVTVTLFRPSGLNRAGHIGVGVNILSPLDTFGHYPLQHSIGVIVGADVPGRIMSDILHKSEADIYDKITIQRTPQEDEAMRRVIEQSLGDRTYNVGSQNCTSFVIEVLRAGGVQVPNTITPMGLMEHLQQTYGKRKRLPPSVDPISP